MKHRTPRSGKRTPETSEIAALRIKLKGRDNAPMTMSEWRETVLQAVRELLKYETGYRIKSADIYIRVIDENGTQVRINEKNELTLYSYKAAADEHGI
jgi:hypothetical protein